MGLPGMMPAPLRAIMEIQTGENLFTGSPIESRTMENLPKSERISDRTSLWATSDEARALASSGVAKTIFQHPLSPVEVDHLVRALFAGAGQNQLSLTNALGGKEPSPGYTPGVSDLTRGLWRTYGGAIQNRTYEQANQKYESGIDDVVARTKATRQYQTANPEEQKRLLGKVDREWKESASESVGIPKSRAKDQPWKYVGIRDVQREQQIDGLISDYQAWVRGGKRGRPPLTGAQMAMAQAYQKRIDPSYTRWLRANRIDSYAVQQQAVGAGR